MKKYIFFIAILFFITINSFTHSASAAPKLEVKAEVGIEGKLKYSVPTPLKITVTNNGSDFSGDLVIDAKESYDVGSALVYPLTVAEGETKTIDITLNSLEEVYNGMGQQQQIINFFEGGIEKGKKIDYKGTKALKTLYADSSVIYLFTLTDNSDRLSGLFRLNEYASSGLEIFHLNDIKGYELPTDSKALQLANILLVDEVSLSDLSDAQQQALYSWVESGGILFVGASDQISMSMGVFQNYLPLELSNRRVMVSASALSRLTSGGEFNQDVEVQKATLNEDGKVILKDGNTILAASRKIGNGQIIQTSFSLGDQPLAGMNGYGNLLSQILDIPNFYPPNTADQDFLYYLPNDVKSVNEIFPSFEVTTIWLIIVIIIYILVVGPILYFVLKRMDKREHAWWIIPSMAIVLSLVMFIFGAKDRLMNSQIQQASYLKVNEDKSLEGYYIDSLLTNRNGDYKFTTNADTSIVATSITSSFINTSDVLHQDSYVEKHAGGSTITLKDLNYWSVKSVIGKTKLKDAGNMEINISLNNNKLEGTIKNNFPFILKDVSIWSGSKEIKLGDIKANETLKVSETLNSTILLSPNGQNSGIFQMPKKKDEINKFRLESLKYGLWSLVQNEQTPAIIAWTNEPIVGVELEGNSKIDATNYIIQTFKPSIKLSDEFTINNDAFYTDVYPYSTNGMMDKYVDAVNRQKNEWEMEKGEFEYLIEIPEEILNGKHNFTEISLKRINKNLSDLQIWNEKKMQYEDFPDDSLKVTSNINDYIAGGTIKIKFMYNGQDYQTIRMPEVELKGVAK